MGAVLANLGYMNLTDFIVKFVTPIVITCGGFAGLIFYFMAKFPEMTYIPKFLPWLVLLLGFGFVAFYPYILFEKKKVQINNNMHYYITYIGTLATLQISRSILFRKVAEKKTFGEIANISKKILYLSKSWNLGYAQTCRRIAVFAPSKLMGDFLDRFAAMLDFGQDLSTFLSEEQVTVLDEYEIEYKKSLENIKMLQEVFVSMTVATGFMMSIALLLPMIMGFSMEVIVQYSLMGVFILDMFMFLLIKSLIPSDSLEHNLKIKSKEQTEVLNLFMMVLPISVMLVGVMFYLNRLPFLLNIAIGITPLFYVGYKAQGLEDMIFKRDKAYPAFIRTVGSIVEIKQGAVTSTLASLRVHDFGTLNSMVINLYRRLRLACDKFESWIYFSAETGSNLIYQFTSIFAESIYLGGNAQKIGDIISNNFQRLLSLRRLRIQLAGGLKGAFYGSLIGFCAASYITARIAQTMADMFSKPFEMAQEGGGMNGVFSSIVPTTPEFDMGVVFMYIGLMVVTHAAVSALIIKLVDGGTKYAALYDFVIMIWLGAAISWFVPDFISKILPQTGNETTDVGVEALIFLLLPIGMIKNKIKLMLANND